MEKVVKGKDIKHKRFFKFCQNGVSLILRKTQLLRRIKIK